MDDKNKLLKRLQICDFVLQEVGLFLDTHPQDQQALAYYQKHLTLRQQTHAQYVAAYGPITAQDYQGASRWQWVDAPWPWQNSSEV